VLEPPDRLVQHAGAGGVEAADPCHPQDHHAHVGHVWELDEEALGGGEEERAVDPEGDDVVLEQGSLLRGVVAEVVRPQRDLLHAHAARHRPQREHGGDRDADADGGDEVEGDRHHEGGRQHDRVGAGGPSECEQRGHLDHPHRRGEQDPRQGRERDAAHERGEGGDDHEQHHRVGEGRELGAGAAAHIDRGPGDGRGGRHPAEDRRGQVGQPLPEELAVRVVALPDSHPVRDGRREQALQRGQGTDGERRRQQRSDRAEVDEGQRGRGQASGQRADLGHIQPRHLDEHRRPDHAEEGERHPRPPSGAEDHQGGDHEGERRLSQPRFLHEGDHGVDRDRPDVLGVGGGDPECGGELLESDHHGDAGGEPLDHRHRQVLDHPTEPQVGHRDQRHSGQHADHEHTRGPVLVDDRDQDDRHRPGRPGDLEVGSAEDRGHRAGHHGGGDAGRRAHPGGDTEAEGERQRDDGDGQTRDQVAPGVAAYRLPIGARRQESAGALHDSETHALPPSRRDARSSPCWVRTEARIWRAARSSSGTSGALRR